MEANRTTCSARSAAMGYRSNQGWCPIPLKKRSKETALVQLAPYLSRPATSEELGSWSWPGVGIVTGHVSGVLVLDVDGAEGEGELKKRRHPMTPMVKTASGGLHLYFRHPDADIRTRIRVAPGLDVKASGGYVVAPPSLGANNRLYEWIVSPEEAELADPPEWLLGLLKPERFKGPAPPVGERIPPGQRNNALASLAGTMRRRGMGEAEILAALRVANERRCQPPLKVEEVEKITASVARYEPARLPGATESAGDVVHVSFNGHGSSAPRRGYNTTDLGNSERFIAQHGENVRYCYPWRTWLVWTGARWERDDSGRVHRLAKETVRSIYREASEEDDEGRRKALAKHARASESETKIRAMISLAQSEHGIPVLPEELDSSANLLNVRNGTIDLRTGKLREHHREDLITKLAPIEYDPKAPAPVWQATLERVLPSREVRTFFKRLCGYAITGDVSEHILPVLYGTGANGKSTILNALLESAGEYGMQAAPDLLIAKRGGHPTEVADLFGMRLVASIEVEDGRRLAEALVKSLTGGDKVRARRMRQDFWQFDPTHTAFLCTNHKPEIRGTDNAIWRRIRLIPFTETLPPAEQDRKLPEKLHSELAGILAWCVEGCLEWRREGLQAPAEVRRATGAYRAEMDVIGAFLRDECEVDPVYKASFASVYDRYVEWCEEGGEKSETRRKFNARLKERGPFVGRRSGPGGSYEWHGLRLLKNQNADFAGKLKQGSQKDYNKLVSSHAEVNDQNNFSSSVASVDPVSSDLEPGESATLQQQLRIRKLIREGMSEMHAHEEVLGKGWVEP